jgi:NAD(P)-dependent dehydrogenase (short-subunit alcohol dehydrogenase family)
VLHGSTTHDPAGIGAIVNMASAAGGGIPRRRAYGTSKAAVAYQNRCLASEWGFTLAFA